MAEAAPETPEGSLEVTIADALNEQDMVKFTVSTKTDMTPKPFAKADFSVTRTHEEFLWLYEKYLENNDHAGVIIPPPPPKPDFTTSHKKLAKLQGMDSDMPQDELRKLKTEIQSEYLAAFQKTVAMHEVFLIRLSHHATLRKDLNLNTFLEYDKDLAGKQKSVGGKLSGWLSSAVAGVTGDGFASHQDEKPFFQAQKDFLTNYETAIAAAVAACKAKVDKRHGLVHYLGQFSTYLTHLGNTQTNYHVMSGVVRTLGGASQTFTTVEKKLTALEDRKMGDLLTYYAADAKAARELMVRRIKAIKADQTCTANLDKAKVKGKKIVEAQDAAQGAKKSLEAIEASAEEELTVFKKRRMAAFRKGLIHYTQCQIRQSRESHLLWKATFDQLKELTSV